MRRFLLLLALLLVFYSCATPPEDAVDGDDEPPAVERETPVEPPPQSEPEQPEPPDEPEPDEPVEDELPVSLLLLNPSDPERIGRRSLLLSAIPGDGRLVGYVIELLSGPIALDLRQEPFELTELASLPIEARSFALDAARDPLVVDLPRGLVDGETYELRVRGVLEDGRETEWVELAPRLELGIDTPVISAESPTIDTTPPIEVEGEGRIEVLVDDSRSFVVEGGGTVGLPEELTAGRYTLRGRTVSPEGLISRFGEAAVLRILADAQPKPAYPVSEERTLTSRPGLQWRTVTGAVGYQARYRAIGASDWQLLPPGEQLSAPVPEAPNAGDRFEWQVRAQNDAGTWFSWSSPERFETGSFALAFLPVIADGQNPSFIRGYAGGSRDEQPVGTITLTRPYEAAVTPITNRDLVTIVDYALDRGFVTVDSLAVWSAAEEPQALVGLGRMDYGEQFGLRFADGRLEAVPGYERHPAIGISWYGAGAVAGLLSYVEGYSPVADQRRGYRLPTEAEWEYLARGSDDRLFPWGGALSGRVSNYYRSFDPFEDVNEPFTGSGGPTNPAGFFDGSSRNGFQTASDASPFGLRDLVGNVWEWTSDRYDPRYYASSESTDPRGPDATDLERPNDAVVLAVALDPNQRVVRGSAWNTRAPDVRLTNRGRYSEGGLSYSIGLRLVRSPRR